MPSQKIQIQLEIVEIIKDFMQRMAKIQAIDTSEDAIAELTLMSHNESLTF